MVQVQVEDGEEVLYQDNSSSVYNTFLDTINREFQHKCQHEGVSLVAAHQIRQSKADWVPGNQYSIRGIPRTKFLPHHLWVIFNVVRRWVSDWEMPGLLVADEIGLGQTFTPVVVAMIGNVQTKRVFMGLPLSILWGNTLDEWVNMARTTILEWVVKNGGGIHCKDWIQCPATFWRSRQLHLRGIQHLLQLWN